MRIDYGFGALDAPDEYAGAGAQGGEFSVDGGDRDDYSVDDDGTAGDTAERSAKAIQALATKWMSSRDEKGDCKMKSNLGVAVKYAEALFAGFEPIPLQNIASERLTNFVAPEDSILNKNYKRPEVSSCAGYD